MDAKQKTNVETLLDKAANAPTAHEAIHFAQAACNAANALHMLGNIERLAADTAAAARRAD